MKYSKLSLVSALAVWNLALGILAEDCETSEPTLRVSSPDQLDVFRDGCSTITGNILIESSYSGDFILNGITDFVGNISMGKDTAAKDLGLFEMLDLGHIDVLTLYQVGNVNLPNLEHGGDLLFVQSGADGEVNLGSLTDVNNLWLWGGWKSTVITSLKTVNDQIEFCTYQFCGIKIDSGPSMVVDLPVLESVNQLTVEGVVTSISVPELKVAGNRAPEVLHSQGLRINVEGDPIEVDFPKVHTLGAMLEVYGQVSRISLGALGNTSTGLNFNTDTPLDIYSTIETAKYAYLWGMIRSVDFPNYVDIPSVSFADAIRPCNETLVKLWAEVSDTGGTEEGYRCLPEDLPVDEGDDEDSGPDEEYTINDNQDTTPDEEDTNTDDQDTNTDDDTADETGRDPILGSGTYQTLPHIGKIAMIAGAVVSACYY